MRAVTSSKLLMVLVLCLALVATACQDAETQADNPAEPTSLPSITTPGSTSTPSPPEITVDAPSDQDHDFPPEFSIDRHGFFPDPLPGSAGAAGSGCVIGQDVLPDGMWFGFVEAAADDTISIDIACFTCLGLSPHLPQTPSSPNTPIQLPSAQALLGFSLDFNSAELLSDNHSLQCLHFRAVSWISSAQNGHFFIFLPVFFGMERIVVKPKP